MTLRQLLGVALGAATFSYAAWAQSQSATLSGTVTDGSGAVIPGVHVKISNIETGEALSGESNDSGTYVIPLIKPGRYNLTAEKQGFKQSQQAELVMETGAQVRIDVPLEVGALSERVLVEARAALLQSESSSVRAR